MLSLLHDFPRKLSQFEQVNQKLPRMRDDPERRGSSHEGGG